MTVSAPVPPGPICSNPSAVEWFVIHTTKLSILYRDNENLVEDDDNIKEENIPLQWAIEQIDHVLYFIRIWSTSSFCHKIEVEIDKNCIGKKKRLDLVIDPSDGAIGTIQTFKSDRDNGHSSGTAGKPQVPCWQFSSITIFIAVLILDDHSRLAIIHQWIKKNN